jgi:hypothetical protein
MNEEAQRYQRTSEICLGRVGRDVLVSNPTPTTDLGGIVRGDRTIEIDEDIPSILHTRSCARLPGRERAFSQNRRNYGFAGRALSVQGRP